MVKINIAIDGPSGAGKGITVKNLAKKLGYNYLDTGAMYRAIGHYLYNKEIKPLDVKEIDMDGISLSFDSKNEIYLNGENIESEIRTPQGGQNASDYATLKVVRDFLSKIQKEIVFGRGYIAEGRDIGSVIMPDAELKIYLTASVEARAKRRLKDFEEKGIADISYDDVVKQVEGRDYQDMSREIAPLKKFDDAVEVDTSDLTIEEQVNVIYDMAARIIEKFK